MIEERYELALDRIRLMQTEDTVKEPYRDYFKKMAEFVLMLDELRDELLDGRYQKFTLEELRTWNRRLYQDVLPEQYEESYANPDYACKMFGKESGQILGMLYAGFHHPVKLREKYSGKSQLIYRTHLLRMCRGEQFHHFGLDSLRTDFL